MLKVGITGGIGSGKSVVCRVFETLGIPVFSADDAAKHVMQHDATLVAAIKALLGDVYTNGHPDRDRISALVYNNTALLQQLNALVHPATIAYANEWMARQQAPYVIKEAAIFFESGSNKGMDVMVGVSAPRALRAARAMQRSHVTADKVQAIMDRQMDDDQKMQLCDHIIINDDHTAVLPQVLHLHHLFLQQAARTA